MKRNKGFTIIELLIVIAIGGILLAVLFGSCETPKQQTTTQIIKESK